MRKISFTCDCCEEEFDKVVDVLPNVTFYKGRFSATVSVKGSDPNGGVDICKSCMKELVEEGSLEPTINGESKS